MKSNLVKILREAIATSGWNQGKEFDVVVNEDAILIYQVGKPRYTLEELIAQCDSSAPKNTDLKAWDSGAR